MSETEENTPRTIDIAGIMKRIPHRYPFLLIDRIVDVVRGESCTGIKNVTVNEPFFQGHFPGHPIMPGVLIIEAMAQTAGTLVIDSLTGPEGGEGFLVYFMSIESARFRKPVVPGDRVEIRVKKERHRGMVWKFKGEAYVDGILCAEAVYSAMLIPLANRMVNVANDIHPSAIIDPSAKLGNNLKIGPYCVVGPEVQLGDGNHLISHVVIGGKTTLGQDNVLYPFVSLGQRPQDLKYHGEPSTLTIGSRNQIREQVTMNPGTEGGGMKTVVGDDGLFMVSVHVAHDCIIGSHVVFANNVTLAGHVTVGDYVVMGGLSAAHQFVRIGAHAMIGGMSGVESDVIPFGVVKGERAHLAGLNLVGLERRGFPRDEIQKLRSAYRTIFAIEGTMAERMEEVAHLYKDQHLVRDVLNFIRARESRALCLPKMED